jgi:transposase
MKQYVGLDVSQKPKALEIPVLCIDARHAKAALAMQLNKTDENDAAGRAQIMRTGWFREVPREVVQCAAAAQHAAEPIAARKHDRDTSNQVRCALRVFGIVLPPGRLSTFDRLAREHLGRENLSAFIDPLLAAWCARH